MMIRRAIAAELPAVADLVNSAYRGAASRAGWTTEADLIEGQRTDVDALRTVIATPGHVILTLREHRGGLLLGCVRLDWTAGGLCALGMLSVSPDVQGKGSGKRLLEAADAFARRKGATAMVITVISLRETLIAWYERHGYVRTGETEPFPYGDPGVGTPLRNDLVFVVLQKRL